MKLKDIIEYFDFSCPVQILQTDAYLETSEHYGEVDEIYTGDFFNIPWWITNMYLDRDGDGESIFIDKENGRIKIYVREQEYKISEEDRKRFLKVSPWLGKTVKYGDGETRYLVTECSPQPYIKFDDGSLHYGMTILELGGDLELYVNDAQIRRI